MTPRNEEAKGVLSMNRNQGAAAAFSGRPGSFADKRRKPRSQDKVRLRKESY